MQQLVTPQEQQFLLSLARETLQVYLQQGKKLCIEKNTIPSARLQQEQGCFVTIHKNAQLRGCIGHILPVQPLYLDIIDNALAAAFHDPRFYPLEENELAEIKLEISILSFPEKLSFTSTDELLKKLQPYCHGVILKKGGQQSTFLPQVWESLPEKRDFLTQLSLKAGLSPDTWQTPGVEMYTYEAFVFHEQ